MNHFPRVLVIYNQPILPAHHPDAASEHDIVATSEMIEGTLREAGFVTQRTCFAHDPSPLVDAVRAFEPDVVFNLFEGLADRTETEVAVAALLEWLQVPFTGSPSLALALGRDKCRTKYLLQGAGLPTPDFMVVEKLPVPTWRYQWPAIVKPACQDSSVGIDQASVVTTPQQLTERTAYILERYGGPVLVEEFIFGRELHANMIEEPGDLCGQTVLTVVPFAEIRFEYEAGRRYWPIYSYAAKWDTEHDEYYGTPLDTPVYLPPVLTERILKLVRQAFRLVGLRDYGRIDLRVTEDGQPYILEVNPNPYLNSIGLTGGLEAIGRSHKEFLADMIWATLWRTGKIDELPRRPLGDKVTS